MGRLLIVDDDPDVRMALAVTLEDSGHEILEESDGAPVLGRARDDQPDVILLDINMPGMDGFQALEQLKTHRETTDIPVIMISARAQPRDREDAIFMGAFDYITKPWSEGELELRVESALTKKADRAPLSGGCQAAGNAALTA